MTLAWLAGLRARIFVAGVAGLLCAGTARAAVQVRSELPKTLQGRNGGEVRALVIGIDAYRHVRPLKGAAADARDIGGALRKMGVKDSTLLVDAEVDRASVMREMERLIARTRSGDLVILSIAGHGTQEPEKVKGSQPDGMDNVFLLPGFELTPAGSQQRVIGREFNTIIKRLEAKGGDVLFVADTCHGGGMAREIDPRADEMSFRQVPRYVLAEDELKPISTPQDAFLTELDFERTAFLAAVDRKTKSPEVRIPGVEGFRGALSYAVARAIEGRADTDGDDQVTLKELFGNVRQVVYQLSDQRQSPVVVTSPGRKIDTEVAFRSVTLLSEAPDSTPKPKPEPAKPANAEPVAAVRIAALRNDRKTLTDVAKLEAPFEVVAPDQEPDLIWDPNTGDAIAGGDVIAYGIQKGELPSVIDRAAAVRGFKRLAAKSPQAVRVAPDDKLHRSESRVEVEITGVSGRALILFNVAGDGTVQTLYPLGADPPLLAGDHKLRLRVREPFGSDRVVAVTAAARMPDLEQALRQMNQRRTAMQTLKAVERYLPADARVGTVGLFTAP